MTTEKDTAMKPTCSRWVRLQHDFGNRTQAILMTPPDSEGERKLTRTGMLVALAAVPFVIAVSFIQHPVALTKALLGVQPKRGDYGDAGW